MDKTTTSNTDFIKFLVSPRYRFARHALLILFMAGMAVSVPVHRGAPNPYLVKFGMFSFALLLFYTNIYLLVPKFLFRKRYFLYLCLIIGCSLSPFLIMVLKNLAENGSRGVIGHNRGAMIFFFNTMLFITSTTAIRLFQRWVENSERINDLERSTRFAELEQLKNQINPHFLFNMLNNTNVLTQKDPEKASQILVKLSDFLRYLLYDSARPQVLLTSEIHFLEDFLSLEKTRRDNFQFTLSKEGELTGLHVAPLMFITFVENAVKHSLDAESRSFVEIRMSVYNDQLRFECVNSKPKNATSRLDGGLGLQNIQRRLTLLYPDAHTLKLTDAVETYAVTLTINL